MIVLLSTLTSIFEEILVLDDFHVVANFLYLVKIVEQVIKAAVAVFLEGKAASGAFSVILQPEL